MATILTGLLNLVPAADAPIFPVSTASITSTSVPNPKKREKNLEVESDYESYDSDDSLKVPYDNSLDASLVIFGR